jgi:hypothetical protein
MKKYNPIYYLLFVLIITGAFSSMALNTYGMKLIGFSCLGFALVFFHETVFGIRKRKDLESWNRRTLSFELILLTILSILFFTRSLLISFPFAEEIFILTVLLLIGNYLYITQKSVRELWNIYRIPAYGLLFYYASLILFSITFIVGILFPDKGVLMAVPGFLLLGIYVIIGMVYKGMIINGEDYTLFSYTSNLKNKTTIAFVAIIMIFSFYTFRDADLIPGMYSGDTPTGYLRLIQEAEAGQANQEYKVDRYMDFKNQYEQFIEKYGK